MSIAWWLQGKEGPSELIQRCLHHINTQLPLGFPDWKRASRCFKQRSAAHTACPCGLLEEGHRPIVHDFPIVQAVHSPCFGVLLPEIAQAWQALGSPGEVYHFASFPVYAAPGLPAGRGCCMRQVEVRWMVSVPSNSVAAVRQTATYESALSGWDGLGWANLSC